MPWVEGHGDLIIQFLDERVPRPFMLTQELWWEHPDGRVFKIPKWFRFNGVSMPIGLAAVPGIGASLIIRFWGDGVFMGFKESALHDYLCTPDSTGRFPVPLSEGNKIFKIALEEANYPEDVVADYFAALSLANS
jgi:hypothetical protein